MAKILYVVGVIDVVAAENRVGIVDVVVDLGDEVVRIDGLAPGFLK